MEDELKKPTKEQNRPLIFKLMKQTFKERRQFIKSNTADGNIKTITEKYSALKTVCYVSLH